MQLSGARHSFESATNSADMMVRLQRSRTALTPTLDAIGSINVSRVFPQPNREFVIQYELVGRDSQLNGHRNRILWGRLFPSVERAREYAHTSQEEIILADDIPLAIPLFPFDPALPLLRTISDARQWTESLRNCLTRFDVSASTPILTGVDVLAYRLERRAVLKLTLTDSIERGRSVAVVVKVMLPRKAQRFEKRMTDLQSAISEIGNCQHLRLPLVYGIDAANGFVFMEYVSGQNIHALVGGGSDFVNACGAAGKLLAELHNVPQKNLPLVTPEAELQQLSSLAETLDEIRPELSVVVRKKIIGLERDAVMLS